MKNRPFRERLGFALAGLAQALRTERSLRTHAVLAVLALLALTLLRPPLVWWALIGILVVLILAAELFNTALEELADHLHPQRHPCIQRVKDFAAAAVLILSLGALWVGILMLIAVLHPG
jgi:diacylglycerol kinase (ATP)